MEPIEWLMVGIGAVFGGLFGSNRHKVGRSAAASQAERKTRFWAAENIRQDFRTALEALPEALSARGIQMVQLSAMNPPAAACLRLKSKGRPFGLLGDKGDLPLDANAVVRILLDRDPELNIENADVFLLESELTSVLRVRDIAVEALHLSKINTGIFAAGSLTNLTAALSNAAPPWFANLINTIAMTGAGTATVRPLAQTPAKRRDPRRLQEVIPGGG